MTGFRSAALAAALWLALAGIAPAQPAEKPVSIAHVANPPWGFADKNLAVGAGPSVLTALGARERDIVEIQTPAGAHFGFRIMLSGRDEPDILYAGKELRERMGISTGEVALALRAVRWPADAPSTQPLSLNRVLELPEALAHTDKTVGLSLAALRTLNMAPGAEARLTGPAGTIRVTLELFDRDDAGIALSEGQCRALGVRPGAASLTLRAADIAPPADENGPPGRGLAWMPTLDEALQQARATCRPLAIYAHKPGCVECRRFAPLFGDPEVAALLRRYVLYHFDTKVERELVDRYIVVNTPALILLRADGKELTRLRSAPAREQLLQTLRQALAGSRN